MTLPEITVAAAVGVPLGKTESVTPTALWIASWARRLFSPAGALLGITTAALNAPLLSLTTCWPLTVNRPIVPRKKLIAAPGAKFEPVTCTCAPASAEDVERLISGAGIAVLVTVAIGVSVTEPMVGVLVVVGVWVGVPVVVAVAIAVCV